MTLPAKTPPAGDIMEAVLIKGDLKKLTPDESVQYYNAVCKSIGLNPLTRPLEYLDLQGKRILYARRDCADQLRKINGISINIVSQEQHDGLLTIHVRAKDRDGREDEDLGVVPFPDTMKGEVRSNQILKCVTKAKRRVTLSISGLGFLDETEVESIPDVRKPKPPAANVMTGKEMHRRAVDAMKQSEKSNAVVDPETGEVVTYDLEDLYPNAYQTKPPPAVTAPDAADDAPPSTVELPAKQEGGASLSIEDMAREAAMRGEKTFRGFYRLRSGAEQARINKIGDELRGLMEEHE